MTFKIFESSRADYCVMEMCGSVLLVFVALVTRTCGYNVDTTQPIIRQTGVDGTEPTAFGAAVAIHRTESAESAERR